MAVHSVRTKCLQCKKVLNATAKVDNKGNVTKYIEIHGGLRKTSPIGYMATYCLHCANKITRPIDPVPVPPLVNPPPNVPQFVKGDRVKYRLHLEWGVGQLLSDPSENKVYVYYVNVGKQPTTLMHNNNIYLIKVTDAESDQPLLDFLNDLELCKKNYINDPSRHNLYVVELNSSVLQNFKFLSANPQYDKSKPCLYVGMTGNSPSERFQKHKEGHKAAYYVKTYGVKLLSGFFDCLNPMPSDVAKKMEEEFSEALRKQGFAVWWN